MPKLTKIEAAPSKEAASKLQEWVRDDKQLAATAQFMFRQADKDDSGSIDKKESFALITSLFRNTGLRPPSEERIVSIFQRLDTDSDKNLSLKEWTDGLRSIVLEYSKDAGNS